MNTSTLLSVIIPVYNDHGTLHQTLCSVKTQTHTNIEVWVVDDGSEDDIKSIADKIDDPRFHYIRLTTHTNANVARNEGIKKSRGNYIAMLDSDDQWLPDHLSDCLQTIQAQRSDGLYGSLTLRRGDLEQPFYVRSLLQEETMINYLLKTGYGAQTSSLFLTASSAKEILWNPDLLRHQDYEFVVRYSKKFKLSPKKEPTVIHISGSSRPRLIHFPSCIAFINTYKKEIEPIIYNRYNQGMLNLAINLKAEKSIVDFYKKQSTFYKKCISLSDYLFIIKPQGHFSIFIHKLIFIKSLLLNK